MRPRPAPRRLVILDGRQRPLAVTLVGQALCVTGEGMAQTLHPIAGIDRVAVFGDVTLSSAALRALAEADRPLAILDGRGQVRAVTRAMHRERTGFVEALDRFALRRDWQQRLGDWKRARIAHHARHSGINPGWAARTEGMGAFLCLSIDFRIDFSTGDISFSRLGKLANTHARLAALAALARAGVPDRWTGGGGDSARNLVPVFAEIAMWIIVVLVTRPGAAGDLARAFAKDDREGRPIAGPAIARLLRGAERPLQAGLSWELHVFYPWLLETVAPGTIPEEDFPWHG